MDLNQIMRELHYGAQYFTGEERTFFNRVWKEFEQSKGIAQPDAPGVLQLYKKIKFLQIDPNEVVSSLESNNLLLSPPEQVEVEGARYMHEYGGTLDMVTLERMLALRQAVHERQHNSLVGRGEAVPAVLSRAQPAQTQASSRILPGPRRPSARAPGAPLRPIPALEAARKLLKG